MRFKLSIGVAYMAFANLMVLPWYVLLTDIRIGDPKVVFAAAFWLLIGLGAGITSLGEVKRER